MVGSMTAKLRKIYVLILLPAILGFVFVFLNKAFGFINVSLTNFSNILAPSIFIMSAVFAVAWPIYYRSFFAHKKRFDRSLSEDELIKFERNLIYIAMMTPYLALTAYFLEFSSFYTASTFLLGFYAIYYFYPSKRRLAFERSIFRVK
jgi:hypothetical protein